MLWQYAFVVINEAVRNGSEMLGNTALFSHSGSTTNPKGTLIYEIANL